MANQVALKKMAAALVVAGVAAGTAQAASVNATANATVIKPISITENTQMDFATVAADSTPATTTDFVMDPATGTVTPSAGGYAAGASAAGAFTVNGDANRNYSVALPAAVVTLAPGVTIDTFTSDTLSYQLDAAGIQPFKVGATLHVTDTAAAGTYSATYTVNVNY